MNLSTDCLLKQSKYQCDAKQRGAMVFISPNLLQSHWLVKKVIKLISYLAYTCYNQSQPIKSLVE